MSGYRKVLNLSSMYSEESSNSTKMPCGSQDSVETAALLVSSHTIQLALTLSSATHRV